MSEDFCKALKITLDLEGKLSNHPADRGGLTYKGITQKTYDIFRSAEGQSSQPVFLASDAEIEQIYWEHYWLLGYCEKLEWPVNLAHFDACVNHGPLAAVELLQTAIDVKVDGLIGPITLGEIKKRGVWETCLLMVTARKGYFLAITNVRKSQEVFLKGWLNRMKKLGHKIIGD